MKRREVEALIPTALADIHAAGEPAAYYNEIATELLLRDERLLMRRAAISNVLSKVGIDYPVIPVYPLKPSPRQIYPALSRLEDNGTVEGYFTPDQPDGPPARRAYRLAKNPDSLVE